VTTSLQAQGSGEERRAQGILKPTWEKPQGAPLVTVEKMAFPLFTAAQCGDFIKLKRLIEEKADVNQRNSHSQTGTRHCIF
jgi:hypothetical protein